MAQHHHALNLPEVLFRIGRHLESLEDVVACSLVCKSFRASFEPYLWMNVQLWYSHVASEEERRQEPMARFISLRNSRIGVAKEEVQRRDRIVHGLQRIAPWIRSLAVHTHYLPPQLRLGDRCTGINDLLITGVPLNYQFDETYWNECEALLRQNSACLRSLTLVAYDGSYYQDDSAQPLWKLFLVCAQHTNLTTLRIRESTISEQGLEALWRICWQLEILELTDVTITDISTPSSHNDPNQAGHDFEEQVSTSVGHSLANGTSTNWSTPAIATTATVRLPKLRELTLERLEISSEHQLEQILLHCPLLQILIWKSGYYDHIIERFCDHFAARAWPCLDWIEIQSEVRYVTGQEHTLLLQSAPRPFRLLDVDIASLEEQTFTLYREHGHFTTLTKIDLTQSAFTSLPLPPGPSSIAVPSKQVQEVLESCPMLEHIIAPMVTAQDITQGKPWVCHRLKTFRVMIGMEFSGKSHVQEGQRTRLKYSEDDKTLCHQIFERLGQLTQLTVLDMGPEQQRWVLRFHIETASLPLRLRMGLGHLSTLRNLETIGYRGVQRIRLGDLKWMLQHWNKLQEIVGEQLSVKWPMTPRGMPDERSKSVMRSLKAREVQVTLDTNVRGFVASRGSETYYDFESESESENVTKQ
ncbi:hypothetical protein B0O80DRAFT_499710 [Mortierella sp. GBAus27b]|nr:hypothetical protein B0O80DRAFT_499710 [Mortierella sp. GBAus27b]